MSLSLTPRLERAPAFESLNDQGRGTQWSVGPGGGLVREGWRALAGSRPGDLRLLAADKDRQRKGWADGLRDLGRDGPPCERGTGVDAGHKGSRELAQAYE